MGAAEEGAVGWCSSVQQSPLDAWWQRRASAREAVDAVDASLIPPERAHQIPGMGPRARMDWAAATGRDAR